MKIHLFPILLCLFFLSCDKKSQSEKTIQEIPLDIKVERFDKIFFETPPKELSNVKKEFPFFFPVGNDDAVWLHKMRDPLWREVYVEVQKKYADIEPVRNDVVALFKHIKYYFPKTKTPKLITIISEMDYNTKAIYADSLVIVSLELYLGKNHKFYQFPNYIKENFEQRQIMPDIVASFSNSILPNLVGKDLMSQMIYYGKQLYLKDLLLPEYNDADKMGYSPEQMIWCQDNEAYMWRYFVEREMLFSQEQKMISRFIAPAPFSKFYLEIDNDSPGRVGAWLGWQIVRSYMKNNAVSVGQLLKTNEKEIFEKSKYKPKK
jgi:gliding motility-associated lipoprotein GldB